MQLSSINSNRESIFQTFFAPHDRILFPAFSFFLITFQSMSLSINFSFLFFDVFLSLSLASFFLFRVYDDIKLSHFARMHNYFGIDLDHWDDMDSDERKGIQAAYFDSIRREYCENLIQYHDSLARRGACSWHLRHLSLKAGKILSILDNKYNI